MKNSFILRVINTPRIQKSLLTYKNDLPRVVYYHLASDESFLPYYYKKSLFSSKLLNDQLNWFKNQGYKFISLDEAKYLITNNESAKKTIAFTTDDGFEENYSIIAPIFQKHNIKPTLFLISNCIDNNDLMWNNKVLAIKNKVTPKKEIEISSQLSEKYNLRKDIKDIVLLSKYWPTELKDEIANYAWKIAGIQSLSEYLEENKPYMTNSQIKELLNLGYTIGSHSMSHPDFSKLSEDDAKNEMINSKITLEKTFNVSVTNFAYPYGIRASKIIEKEILQNGIYDMLLGTKSNLTNNNQNKSWERDKMEQDESNSQFWFTAIPILRNRLLHPLHLYK